MSNTNDKYVSQRQRKPWVAQMADPSFVAGNRNYLEKETRRKRGKEAKLMKQITKTVEE